MAHKALEQVATIQAKHWVRRLISALAFCIAVIPILLMLGNIRQLFSFVLFDEKNQIMGLLLELLFGIPLLLIPVFVSFFFLPEVDKKDISGKIIMPFLESWGGFLPAMALIVFFINIYVCLHCFCRFIEGCYKTLISAQ